MKTKLFKVFILFVIVNLLLPVANAEVRTAEKAGENSVRIAGNKNFYPVEYYNSKTKQFEGVMPEILDMISKRTGIDFTYIYSKDSTQTKLANNNQVEIVSAYVTDSSVDFEADSAKVFSYADNGKTVNIGLAFTGLADKSMIEAIKKEVAKITENEINGYFVAAGHSNKDNVNLFVTVSLICCIVFAIIILFVCIRLKKVTQQMDINKMTDYETGIGNLAYFDYNFENTITGDLRTSYYITYIIIDNNFLQYYHGESGFIDVAQYTATILVFYNK